MPTLFPFPSFRVHITAASPTFPLDAVVLLTVLMWQRVGARLRQHVLWGACDPVLALGVLGAQGARGGHTLDLATEWALAGAHPLAHCTARHYWILLGTMCRQAHTNTKIQLWVITLYVGPPDVLYKAHVKLLWMVYLKTKKQRNTTILIVYLITDRSLVGSVLNNIRHQWITPT